MFEREMLATLLNCNAKGTPGQGYDHFLIYITISPICRSSDLHIEISRFELGVDPTKR